MVYRRIAAGYWRRLCIADGIWVPSYVSDGFYRSVNRARTDVLGGGRLGTGGGCVFPTT
jgi:hypothetical protein